MNIEIIKTDRTEGFAGCPKFTRDVYVDGVLRGYFRPTWGTAWSLQDLEGEVVTCCDGPARPDDRMFEDVYIGHTIQANNISDMTFKVRAALHKGRLLESEGLADRQAKRDAVQAEEDLDTEKWISQGRIDECSTDMLELLEQMLAFADHRTPIQPGSILIEDARALVNKARGVK